MDVGDLANQDDRSTSASLIPRVTIEKPSTCPPNLKRPQPRDIYNIEVSPQRGEEEAEIQATRLMKRAKTAVKANKSFTPPERSLGNAFVAPAGGSDTDSRLRPQDCIVVSESTVTNDDDGEDITHTPKRKRGRPRKNQPKDATDAPTKPEPSGKRGRPRKNQPDSPIASSSEMPAGQVTAHDKVPAPDNICKPGVQLPVAVEKLPAAVREQDGPEEEPLPEDDYSRFTDILMNPSPVKPIQPIINANYSHGNPRAGSCHKRQEVDEDVSDESEHGFLQDKSGDRERGEFEFEDLLFKEDVLAKMVEIANRAGCRLDKRSGLYVQIVSPKLVSSNGKRIIRRIDKLLENYRSSRELKGSKNNKAKSEVEKSIQHLTLELQTEAKSILETRLGNPKRGIGFFDGVKTRNMLHDLYYIIIRRIVELIHLATDIYPLARSIDSSGLHRVLTLVEILEDLASTALLQPKEFQPEQSSKSATHQIIRPTRHLMPRIREIHESLTSERLGRERAARASGSENRSPETKARTDEHARQEASERDARRKESKEIRRLQRKMLEQRKAEPIWGLMIINDIVRKSGKAANRNEIRKQNSCSSNHEDESNQLESIGDFEKTQDDDDPFAEDDNDEYDRVSVFGKNNRNDRSRPLSAEEKDIFVECMMKEQGEDRYEKAAEALQRSMDEIFSFAQDLQEAMDRKHAEGKFNRPSDDWTHVVWVTPA
ncbi:hypothetical protein BUE80_DR011134 [Diplocarpon rosae]|nr:hypothetical protein BUE80_DR011134 [Diplocarpon rosae]